MLEKGRFAKIFQKPLTIEDFEGHAKLIEKISEDETSERWKVQFQGDSTYVERTIAKYQDLDFDSYKLNMRVVLRNQRADVRLEDRSKCPGAVSDRNPDEMLELGDCENCYCFMGCKTPNQAFVGDTMPGCCWKLVLIEKGFIKIA